MNLLQNLTQIRVSRSNLDLKPLDLITCWKTRELQKWLTMIPREREGVDRHHYNAKAQVSIAKHMEWMYSELVDRLIHKIIHIYPKV